MHTGVLSVEDVKVLHRPQGLPKQITVSSGNPEEAPLSPQAARMASSTDCQYVKNTTPGAAEPEEGELGR